MMKLWKKLLKEPEERQGDRPRMNTWMEDSKPDHIEVSDLLQVLDIGSRHRNTYTIMMAQSRLQKGAESCLRLTGSRMQHRMVKECLQIEVVLMLSSQRLPHRI